VTDQAAVARAVETIERRLARSRGHPGQQRRSVGADQPRLGS
jgi:hypothetical protein